MAFSGLMSKVNFANKVPLLMRATSGDPNLPAGHVYEEISRITYDSLEQCDVLVEFLTERLKKNSPHIKLKVLMVMKSVLQKGHKEFQHSLSRQDKGIREARSFNGPPDPLHGDAPYVKVREAAALLLQMLFDTDRTENKGNSFNAHDSSKHTAMDGFGGSRISTGGSTSGNMKTMEGFGNTDSVKSESSIISNVFQRVKDNVSYAFNENANSIARLQQGRAPSSTSSYQNYREGEDRFVRTPSNTFKIPGPGTGDPVKDSQTYYTPSNTVKWGKTVDTEERLDDDEPHWNTKENTDNEEDWSQEIRLVNDITIPAGIRLNPSRSELDHFVKKCSSLNFAKIIELISEKLQSPDYKVQMKSLFVVEIVLSSNVSDARETILTKLVDDIERLSSSNQTAVKNKATKLLHLLQPPSANQEKSQSFGNQKEKLEFKGDLVSLEPVATDIKSSGNVGGNDQLSSIFGGLNMQDDNQNQQNFDQQLPDLLTDIADSKVTTPIGQSDLLLGSISPAYNSNPAVVAKSQTTLDKGRPETSLSSLLDLDPFTATSSDDTGNVLTGIVAQASITSNPVQSQLQINNPIQSGSNFDFLDPFSHINDSPTAPQNNPLITPNVMPAKSMLSTSSDSIPAKPAMTPKTANTGLNTLPRRTSNMPNNNMNMNFMQNQGLMSSHGVSTQPRPNTSYMTPGQALVNANREQQTVVNRPMNQSSSAGFQFISSKKPGAFDFVKDAMEASKRK